MQPRTFPADLADLHLEWENSKEADPMVFYMCRFRVTQRMRLAILLGYDGPVKVWLDGKEIWHDPDGTNPASGDEAAPAVSTDKGRHEIMIALSSHDRNAWGVMVRLERLGLSQKSIDNGNCTLPEFLQNAEKR